MHGILCAQKPTAYKWNFERQKPRNVKSTQTCHRVYDRWFLTYGKFMNYAIIVAAGNSRRMKSQVSKVFINLMNKPILYHTLKAFHDCQNVDEIIVVVQKKDVEKVEKIKNEYGFSKLKEIVEGGVERQDSVLRGIKSIINARDDDVILIHNGSNPLVKNDEINECINEAKKHGAAFVGFPLKDTIKKLGNKNFVERTIERNQVYQVQTPQAIKYSLMIKAFDNARDKKLNVTDDVSLVESLGEKVKMVPCSYENIKITSPEDLTIAEGILMARNKLNFNFRIGFGQDSHHFAEDSRKMALGGCIINETGFDANSDGDVILHALFNAISQAIGDRSLGYYSDEMCKNGITDSKQFLKIILKKLDEKNLKINNLGIMIEAGKPRLEQYTNQIKISLSQLLDLSADRIGITYTSGEQLTSFGKGEGMQCFCIVSLIGNIQESKKLSL